MGISWGIRQPNYKGRGEKRMVSLTKHDLWDTGVMEAEGQKKLSPVLVQPH